MKLKRISITLILAISILSSGLIGGPCLCGNSCVHNKLGDASRGNILHSLFHPRCFGGLCKSCDNENSRSTTIFKSSPTPLKLKSLDTHFVLSLSSNYFDLGIAHIAPSALTSFSLTPSVPIFLKNKHFLC
jgi:hypothetical protein